MKTNDQLTPSEIKAMPLAEFSERFGFRPKSAIEKHFFAGMAKRPDVITLQMLEAGVMGQTDTTGVVMN